MVCTLILVLSVASAGISGIFNFNSRLAASVPCLIGLSPTLFDLIEHVGVGSILYETEFDLVSTLFAWHSMRAIDWPSLSPIPGSQWLPYSFMRGYVGVCPSPGQARAVVNGHDIYTGLPVIPSIPLLGDLGTWFQVREEAARYFHPVHKTPLPDSLPNTSVLLDPPATTKEAQPDSSVPNNEAQPSSAVPDPLAASPPTKFLGLALQPLVLLDSQRLLATSLRSMPRSGVL